MFRNINFWRLVAAIEFLLLLAGLYIYFTDSTQYMVRPRILHPDIQRFGKCVSVLPNPVTDSNTIKLEVIVKGKDLALRKFEWDGYIYTSNPGCFRSNADRSVKTMTNYIPVSKGDTVVPFQILVRTEVTGNEMEFSIKAYNLRGVLIGTFPESGGTHKEVIPSIGFPAFIRETVRLKL